MRLSLKLVFLVFCVSTKVSGSALTIDPEHDTYDLDGSVYYLVDTTNKLDVRDVMFLPLAGLSRSSRLDTLLGNRRLWLRIPFENNARRDRQMLMEVGKLPRFTVVVLDRDNHFLIDKNGYEIAPKNPVELHDAISFIIPSVMKTGDIIIRLDSSCSGSDILRLKLWDYNARVFSNQTSSYIDAFLTGILAILALYHLFLYAFSRNRAFLFFSLFVILVLSISVTRQLVPRFLAHENLIAGSCLVLAIVAFLLYLKMLVDLTSVDVRLPRYYTVMNRITIVLLALIPAVVAVCFFARNIEYARQVTSIFMTLVFAFTAICCLPLLRSRELYSTLFVAGSLAFLLFLSVGVPILVMFDENIVGFCVINAGVVAQMLLYSFAIWSKTRVVQQNDKLSLSEMIVHLEGNQNLHLQLIGELEDALRQRNREIEGLGDIARKDSKTVD